MLSASGGSTRVGVVMAGGAGERFWPISRAIRPKQLLPLGTSGRTLLQETVDRLRPLMPDDRLFIVTGGQLRDPILESNSTLQPAQVLAEPDKRGTLGCIAYATAYVLARYAEAPGATTFAILPADHYVTDAEAFRQGVEAGMAAAEHEDALVIVGVTPTRPETGYGYIEIASNAEPLCVPGTEEAVWAVDSFREKPSPETAREFLDAGRFLWNSGMFFWRASTFLSELERARPRVAELIGQMTEALRRDDIDEVHEAFAQLPDLSIDYALMEHAGCVRVIRANFAWDDFGAWDAYHRVAQPDGSGNVTVGDPVLIESRNCVVYNEPGAERVAVALVGMDGVVVAVADDGVLVAPLARAQEVREAVAALKQRGAKQI